MSSKERLPLIICGIVSALFLLTGLVSPPADGRALDHALAVEIENSLSSLDVAYAAVDASGDAGISDIEDIVRSASGKALSVSGDLKERLAKRATSPFPYFVGAAVVAMLGVVLTQALELRRRRKV